MYFLRLILALLPVALVLSFQECPGDACPVAGEECTCELHLIPLSCHRDPPSVAGGLAGVAPGPARERLSDESEHGAADH